MYTFEDVAEATELKVTFLEELITEKADVYQLNQDYYFDPDISHEVQFAFTEEGLTKLMHETMLVPIERQAVQQLMIKQEHTANDIAQEILLNARNRQQTAKLLTALFQQLGIAYVPFSLEYPDLETSKADEFIAIDPIARNWCATLEDVEAFKKWLCPHHTFGTNTPDVFVATKLGETHDGCITFNKTLLAKHHYVAQKLEALKAICHDALLTGNYVAQKSFIYFDIDGMKIKIPYSQINP